MAATPTFHAAPPVGGESRGHGALTEVNDGLGLARTAGMKALVLRHGEHHFGDRTSIHVWLTGAEDRSGGLMRARSAEADLVCAGLPEAALRPGGGELLGRHGEPNELLWVWARQEIVIE